VTGARKAALSFKFNLEYRLHPHGALPVSWFHACPSYKRDFVQKLDDFLVTAALLNEPAEQIPAGALTLRAVEGEHVKLADEVTEDDRSGGHRPIFDPPVFNFIQTRLRCLALR
jgi:hypothetical protein